MSEREPWIEGEVRALVQAALPEPVERFELSIDWYAPHLKRADLPAAITRSKAGKDVRLTFPVLAALVPDDGSRERVTELDQKLGPRGIQVVRTAGGGHKDFVYLYRVGVNQAVERFKGQALVVFFRYPNKTPLLWARGTNGANYDVGPQELIDRLQAWSTRSAFRLVGAGVDWIELQFQRLPSDLTAFAQEVYDFCPDTLDQGIVKPIAAPALGPDPNPEALEEFFEAMDDALESQTPADLAESLRRERSLFLWWD